jgi:hypothetical protein
VNHEDNIAGIAKACAKIADILPRAEISLKLYQTELMIKAMKDLYISILEFLKHAIEWYKQGKFGHTWIAISKPWELGFQEEIEEIEKISRRIDNLAGTSSQAELRATRLEVLRLREDLKGTNSQVEALIKLAQSESLRISIIIKRSHAPRTG